MRKFWLLFSCLTAISCAKPSAPKTQEIAFWHWHSPFNLSAEQVADLKALKVSELFVRAATFSNDGEMLVPILAQRFEKTEEPFKVHLVYNMDAGALKHFELFEVKAMAKVVSDRFKQDSSRASNQGLNIQGLQLDFDVPTRLLPRYADLLREVKTTLEKDQKLSITSLPTWFTSKEFSKVVDQTDFYAPQFYDTEMPGKLTDTVPILDRRLLDRSLEAAAKLGKSYYAGISSFGRALLYDPVGNLQGTYMGLSPDQALRHPVFELENDSSNPVERVLTFVAVKDGPSGQGKGWHLVFRIPKPSAIGEALSEIQQRGGSHCLGTAVFRVPEPDETMVLPLSAIIAQVQGDSVKPELKVSLSTSESPWERIETGQSSNEEKRIHLTVENVGIEPLNIGKDCLNVQLSFEPGSLIELVKGSFDKAIPTRDGLPSSLKSANQMTITRLSLRAGEKASIGPILVKPGTLLNWEWSAVTLSGGKSSGKGRIDSNGKEVVGLENGASRPGSR